MRLKCELCGSTDKVFPHLHYEKHYQYPRFMIICRRCHKRIHRKMGKNSDVISRTIRISRKLWREAKIYAVNNDLTISELIEDALRKRLKSPSSGDNKEKKEEAKAESDNIKFNFEG